MASRPEPQARFDPLAAVRHIDRLRHERVTPAPVDPRLLFLRSWQSRRLARTYADLLEHPRYRPACQFFLDDLYGPRDFSQRDHDLTRLYEFVRSLMPEPMIRPLARSVELHFFTQALDARLLDVLVNQLGVTDTLTVSLYAEAYRLCDNYADRVRQIEMIVEIGNYLDAVVRVPLAGMALALAHGPAIRGGWVEMTEFLERGFEAFEHMRGAKPFLAIIQKREMQALDKIYARDPDPFGFEVE